MAVIEQALRDALEAEAEQLFPADESVRPLPALVPGRRAVAVAVAAAVLVVATVGVVGLLRRTAGADDERSAATVTSAVSQPAVEFPIPGNEQLPPGSLEVPLVPITSATSTELDWLETVRSPDRIVAVGELDGVRVFALIGAHLADGNESGDNLCLVMFAANTDPKTVCGSGSGLVEVATASPDMRTGTVGVVGSVAPDVAYVSLKVGDVTYVQRPNAGIVYLVRPVDSSEPVSWTTFTADNMQVGHGSIAGPQLAAATTTTLAEGESGIQAYACGSELPFDVELPDDFSGPFEGASPASIIAPEDGQLVIHWTGRGGFVELRWPGDAIHFAGVTWGELPPDPFDSTMFLLPWTPIMDGVAQEPLVDAFGSLPSMDMEGPCDAVQLEVFTGAGREVSAAFGPASGDELGITVLPSLPRSRDLSLIVDTLYVDEIPDVVACEGGAPNRPPNRTRSIDDGPSFSTSREAFQAILTTADAEAWPRTGYFELIIDDASIVYGNPVDDLRANPLPDAGLVIAVSVQKTDTGWIAIGWETSGC